MDILDGVKDFKDKITITKDGVEKPCMIMFSFEMNGKEFIVYTDGSVNDQGNINAYASILDRSKTPAYDGTLIMARDEGAEMHFRGEDFIDEIVLKENEPVKITNIDKTVIYNNKTEKYIIENGVEILFNTTVSDLVVEENTITEVMNTTLVITDLLSAENVIFYGFSMGMIDYGYFSEFFNAICNGTTSCKKIYYICTL